MSKKVNETKNNKETRNPPKECYLAKDFLILYRLSKKISKTEYYYNISFRSYLDRKQDKRNKKTYGKILIEKGIPVKDLNEIENLIIEKIWNDSDFRTVVKDEVFDALENGRIDTVSLLLLSYIFYDEISNNKDFNKKVFLKIIKDEAFRNIMLDDTINFYLNFAIAVFCEDNKNITKKSLQVHLNFILQFAYEIGLIKDNTEINLIKESASSAEYRKLRSNRMKALAEKSLSIKSETDLIEWFVKKINSDNVYLGVLIKLFTGMSNPEICALQWGDYQEIKYTNGKRHHLIISKKINDKTKELDYFGADHRYKYRVIPIPAFLDTLIGEQYNKLIDFMIKKYRKIIRYELTTKKPYNLVKTLLASLGIDNISYQNFKNISNDDFYKYYEKTIKEEIKDYPMLSQNNKNIKASEKFIKPFAITTLRHSAQKALDEGFNKVENKSRMHDHDKTIDYSKQGNKLFRTNYQFHVISDCNFSLGEMNYIVGNSDTDTFSKHYCDYTNDLVQIQLAEKLDRWADAHFDSRKEDLDYSKKLVTETPYQLKPIKSANNDIPAATIIITSKDCIDANIYIDNNHGFEGNVTLYKMN